MNPKRSVALLALLSVVALAAALVLVGCGQTPSDPATGTYPTGQAPEPSQSLAPPGIYEVEGGKTQALGTLDYRDIEGGFWAVVDTPVAEDAAKADVVAVIPNADKLGVDLESMKGSYVSAIGKKLDGASIRMAGPEIEAETIEVVSDTNVEAK